MPIIQDVETIEAKQVWQSPDRQRTIYDLTLNAGGSEAKASTYSGIIATVGWKGDVETYEKPGKNGSTTYVKQAPKENAPKRSVFKAAECK